MGFGMLWIPLKDISDSSRCISCVAWPITPLKGFSKQTMQNSPYSSGWQPFEPTRAVFVHSDGANHERRTWLLEPWRVQAYSDPKESTEWTWPLWFRSYFVLLIRSRCFETEDRQQKKLTACDKQTLLKSDSVWCSVTVCFSQQAAAVFV